VVEYENEETDEEETEEIVYVKIYRPPGKPLGFRISGGTQSSSCEGKIKVTLLFIFFLYSRYI
jgi:hypothetical protein